LPNICLFLQAFVSLRSKPYVFFMLQAIKKDN